MKTQYITKSNVKAEPKSFPKLMKSLETGNIILFKSQNAGTPVHIEDENSKYSIGDFDESWISCEDDETWVELRKGQSVVLTQD